MFPPRFVTSPPAFEHSLLLATGARRGGPRRLVVLELILWLGCAVMASLSRDLAYGHATSQRPVLTVVMLLMAMFVVDLCALWMSVTVMDRGPQYTPNTVIWYWVKYESDGCASRMDDRPVAGKVGMCIDCHAPAGGNDFTFANDR